MRTAPRFAALLAVPALVVSIGCAKPTPVGKWTGPVTGLGQSTLEFSADNKVTVNGNIMMIGAVTATGTYTLDGEKIAMKFTDLQSGGKSVMAMIPANMRGALDQNDTWKIEDGTLIIGTSKFEKVK